MARKRCRATNPAPPKSLASSLSRFRRIVLGWDYVRLFSEFSESAAPPIPSTRESEGGLKRARNSYENFDEYLGVLEPLLFEEVKAQIVQQYKEVINGDDDSHYRAAVAKCTESDGFYKVDLVIVDVSREEVSENDLLILSDEKVCLFFKFLEAKRCLLFS